MEKLKSILPQELKRAIDESGPNDLPSTCSALLHFCLQTPHFHKMIGELADADSALCGKNLESALDLKSKGNSAFRTADYATALYFYSKALRAAPIDALDMEKNLVSALYVNRASSLYKMDKLVECIRDCNRAIVISPNYAKAWYRRGAANAALGDEYHATCDLNVSRILEPSLSGRRLVEREIEVTRDQCRRKRFSVVHQEGRSLRCIEEKPRVELNIVHTPSKGRGFVSSTNVPEATLVHAEQPYATIILKRFRDTHCHFCLNELPADVIPCPSCSIPVYCSRDCQLEAGGEFETNKTKSNTIHENLPDDLQKHVTDVTLMANYKLVGNDFAEHRHECKGVNWPAVLPPDIVLAGRILMKLFSKGKQFADKLDPLDLSHNYIQMTTDDKLECHIYAAVLLCCLQKLHGPEIQPDGLLMAQLVILISQVKVNSMAVVRMKSTDLSLNCGESRGGRPSTSNVEQIRVGQAIYLSGSMFNHSCQPNIHAYFISRTLFVRSTKFVGADCPLELSYGPQVGQWDLKDRQLRLYNDYSFKCQCDGCVHLNLSDLLLNAFGCADKGCCGVVLDIKAAEYEKKRLSAIQSSPKTLCSKHLPQSQHHQAKTSRKAYFNFMAYDMLTNESKQIKLGYCIMCGSHLDLEVANITLDEARIPFSRLQDAIDSEKIQFNTILDAVESFKLLKSVLHKYNKQTAEFSDILCRAFCVIGDLPSALSYCKTSIEILERLYEPEHIVIAYELWKLSSIQLALGDNTYIDSLERVHVILSGYYGSHVDAIFPQVASLRQHTLCSQ